MTDKRGEVIVGLLYVVVIAAYIGVVCYLMVPGFRERVDRTRQWGAYYQWKARFVSLPTYVQEAMIVRGLGPEDA